MHSDAASQGGGGRAGAQHEYLYTDVCAYMHTYVCAFIHTCMYACMYTYMCVYM